MTMNISGFTSESLEAVNAMLYAEGQENPLRGQCGQKGKRQQAKQPRTPAQQQADRQRAQENRGQDKISSSIRSEAAKKAAETRRRCKGLPASSPSTSASSRG